MNQKGRPVLEVYVVLDERHDSKTPPYWSVVDKEFRGIGTGWTTKWQAIMWAREQRYEVLNLDYEVDDIR